MYAVREIEKRRDLQEKWDNRADLMKHRWDWSSDGWWRRFNQTATTPAVSYVSRAHDRRSYISSSLRVETTRMYREQNERYR